MAKFHINSSGESGNCRAEKSGCPFGDDDQHYATAAEASAAYEGKMADQVVPEPIERENTREQALPQPEALAEKKTPTEEFEAVKQAISETHDRMLRLNGSPEARVEKKKLDEEMKVLADSYQTAYRNLPDYQERENKKKAIVVDDDIRRLESELRYLHKLAYAPRQRGESRPAYKERMRLADGPKNMPAVTRTNEHLGITERDPARSGYKILIEQKTAQLRKMQDKFDVLEGREPATNRPPVAVPPKKPEGGLRGFFSRF